MKPLYDELINSKEYSILISCNYATAIIIAYLSMGGVLSIGFEKYIFAE